MIDYEVPRKARLSVAVPRESESVSSDLSSCPFCNGDAVIYDSFEGDDGLDDIWVISCNICPAEMRGRRQENKRLADRYPDEKESIIKLWNTRPQ